MKCWVHQRCLRVAVSFVSEGRYTLPVFTGARPVYTGVVMDGRPASRRNCDVITNSARRS